MSIYVTKGEHTMFKAVINWFAKTQKSGLEEFISSKNPQSEAEVELWARQYDEQFVWGRGF